MNVIYSVKDYVTNVLDFHQGTASGAIDIVTVQHEDGSVRCTPFHVHFGKAKLKRVTEKVVTIIVNGSVVDGVHMKLGAAGEAFFVDQVEEPVEDDYSTSPLVSPTPGSGGCKSNGKQGALEDFSLPLTPRESTFSRVDSASKSLDNTFEDTATPESHPEWHDAYRVVPETLGSQRRDIHSASERLTWGWGALPVVQPAASSDNLSLVDTDTEDELPMMVKSESVYFDAFEGESGPSSQAYVADHPCMSLCGHLLDEVESQEEKHVIFSEHIINYESFRENPAAILRDRNLMFLIDGQILPFDAEVQAYLISRVLFPDCAPLSLGSGATTSSAQAEGEETQQSSRVSKDGDNENDLNEESIQDDSIWSKDATAHGTSLSVQVIPQDDVFHRKSLQPSQEDILKMGLRFGANDIEFVVHTALKEELRVSAKMYFWPVSAKIVIAEIDGAVSRIASNGMFSNLLSGKEKERPGLHTGALDFYAKLARNGYRIVYLTSRGLSQADLMHGMLRSSLDDTGLALPNGPVLLAPDRLLATNSNEMIDSRDFKVAALNGIRALFPSDVNPFYAAFGRTFADSVIFTQVGVFPGKVFLVDEGDGRLRHKSMLNFQESYSSLVAMLDKMFPPICSPVTRRPTCQPSGAEIKLLGSSSSSSSSLLPQQEQRKESFGLKRNYTSTEDLVSDVISSQVRTRSMGDEAFNDVNFWRIRPGRI
uniref:phosphatidate phosphatase n=1 Tax=Globisporangium ultimum (strain ATCC 200006 / CBS 805.95 / DAOM BR144) TaxID=431595 RepID=K3WBX2_GLOUD